MINKIPRQEQAFAICTIAAIFYCYQYYLRVAPSVISQELISTFQVSYAGLGLLSALFYYSYMLLQIPIGMLLDKFGPRRTLTIACAICVAGTYLFCSTDILWIAQTGRFIIGFGAAFAFIGFLKICAIWLPHKFYAFMVGLCMLLGTLGAVSGEVVLATLIQTVTWQIAFAYSALAGLILTGFIWVVIRDRPNNTSKSVLATGTSLRTSTFAVLGNSQIWLSGIIGCCTFLPLSCFAEMWAIPYLETVGYAKTEAAFASSMLFLGFGIGAPLWGLVSNWLRSRRTPLILGSLVSAICAVLIIIFPDVQDTYMFYVLFMLGFFSGAEILIFAIGNDIMNKDQIGTATALLNMLVMVGGIIIQPVIGMILDVISKSSVSQYQTALLVLPISLFIACGLSICLKETYKT